MERGMSLTRNMGQGIWRREGDIHKLVIEAKYNPRCREVKGVPKFLKETSRGADIKVIVKIRSGNFEEINKYWLAENERQCGFCGRDLQEVLLIIC